MFIKLKNISKSFKLFKRKAGLKGALRSFIKRNYQEFHALKDINLNIEKGEIIGILGENGAGKTTLIKLMIGLLYPSTGKILVNGFIPWEKKHDYLKTVSIVMGQKNQLWWDIPASESFLLNKHIYNIENSNYQKTLDELVDFLEVRDKIDIQVRRLSLGERMKMEIIASLLHNPSIVLLDEPTLGLDVISQSKIREFVKYYNEKNNTTFVITSHYTRDIEEMCKRVHVLNKGKSIYDGDFELLISKINPQKKLIFKLPDFSDINSLNSKLKRYTYDLDEKILTSIMPEKDLHKLLNILLENYKPENISFEDLPVDETMKSFFENPSKFLK